MKRIGGLVRSQWIGILALFLVLAGGGAFAAFDPIGNDGDVDACFEKKSGDLDLLKGKKCGKGEKTVSWAAEGPQGLQGAAGPPGEAGPPGAPGLLPIARGFDATTVSTTNATPTNLGGPSVTVTVGDNGGFVLAAATGEISTGDGATSCNASVISPSFPGSAAFFAEANTGPGFLQAQTMGGPNARFLPPGTHTIRIDYNRSAGPGTCSYKNRRLVVALIE